MDKDITNKKQAFVDCASRLGNYKQISQIDLAEGCLLDTPLRDAYFAALVVRYWSIPQKMFYKDHGLYDEYIAFDWLIDGLLYILKQQAWKDPKSTVYQDPKAIEKMVNRTVTCSRINFFHASNRQCRVLNHNIISTEQLEEEFGDHISDTAFKLDFKVSLEFRELLDLYIKEHKTICALIFYILLNSLDISELASDNNNLTYLILKEINGMVKSDFELVMDNQLVDFNYDFIYNISTNKLIDVINFYLIKLKKDLRVLMK